MVEDRKSFHYNSDKKMNSLRIESVFITIMIEDELVKDGKRFHYSYDKTGTGKRSKAFSKAPYKFKIHIRTVPKLVKTVEIFIDAV